MKIILVACVAKKLDRPAPAKDLYQSTWFKKARKYAELTGDRWFILSALYGLVHPEMKLGHYNHTLKGQSDDAKRQWAEKVVRQLAAIIGEPSEVVILAGLDYRRHLEIELLRDGHTIYVPMTGLGIGQQVKWLNERIKQIERLGQ